MMNRIQAPKTEQGRIAALRLYDILDTQPEQLYDNLAQLAAEICNTPIALITLVDEHRVWVKASVGIDIHAMERQSAFCHYTILDDEIFEISNPLADSRFANNEIVTGPAGIRFYAGIPLINKDGYRLGALSVMTPKHHQLNSYQRISLQILGDSVIALLELRRERNETDAWKKALETTTILSVMDAGQTIISVNDQFCKIAGLTEDEIVGRHNSQVKLSDLSAETNAGINKAIDDGQIWNGQIKNQNIKGMVTWNNLTVLPVTNKQNELARILTVRTDVTGEVLAKERLAETEKLSASGSWELNIFNRQTYWTAGMFDLLEFDSQEERPAEQSLMSFIAPEDFDRVNEMNKRMLEKKTTSETLEFKIITSKGNQKTVSAVVNKRFNNRGGLTGIYGTLHDITYKNIAPVQIDNSIKAARELLNNTPCGLLTLDADRHITEINDFLLRLLGYNKEQVIARLTPADIVARNDRAYINDMLLRLRDEARTERMEINLVRVNKATVPVSLTAYSHFSETGEYVHTNMIFTDHTEVTTLRKTVAELEARAKENNDSPLMMITVGPDGIITGASGKFLNYLGYSERDVTGKTFSFAYDDETRRRTAAWYNKQLHDNVAETTWLLPAVSKNGDKHWLELTGNLTGNKEQTISCLVYDVTGRIKTEEELHEVAWMAMEARNAHQSLTGKLNSGLSEPANGIMSLVNMLGTTHLSVEQKVLVAGIKESSQHLVLAIDELKTDTDATETTPLNEDEFELKHLVNSVIFAHKPDADRKKLRFALQIDNKIPATVWGNPTLLSRILDHLVENAVKHTDSGSVSISVLQRDVLNNNLTLEFIVKDSGPGIAAMKLEKLLEGQDNMGLAATRLLVEQQNGQFRIRSNEEAGTVISFTYTLKKTLRSTPKEDKQHLKLTEESVSLLGYNILLVEDNVMNQRVGTVTVSNWGANVTVADRGRKAIDLMKHERFDVVLMDLQMPEMSGIEATEIIRQQLKDNTPIIGMTVSEQQGSRETCLKAGMNEYILKPLNPVELNQKMLSLLKKKAVIAPEKLTNINYIRNLTSDDSTLITEILEIYISKTPPLLAEIERYISSGQYKSAQAGVHYLKNSVGLLGADTLFHLLATIEDQLNYLPPSEDTLKLLVKMYESVMQSIHDAEEDLSNL